ncbi:hypothetical protein FRX31_005696 [Thalictrum thalictroides]|uniref:Thionin-like protein n=1 Tax=Thalictrum thalictroides TaxID=46969 RepID=A0A7J6X4R8_THATH|nr:hypothetical protein FRX31_005696 [Thalictrum thalictroides]
MDAKNVRAIVVMVVILVGMLVRESTSAPSFGTCYGNCITDCSADLIKCGWKCLKHCALHNHGPNSSSSAVVSDAENYCKLGCAFDLCFNMTNDEQKMGTCVMTCSSTCVKS